MAPTVAITSDTSIAASAIRLPDITNTPATRMMAKISSKA